MLPPAIKRLFGFPVQDRRQPVVPGYTGVFLHGEGDYAYDVIEVSGQQGELYHFFARITGEEDALQCIATLDFERSFQDPGERVGVAIEGRVTGYCPSFLGNQIRVWLEEWNYAPPHVICSARLVHRRGIRSTHADRFVLKLDIAIPFKMTTF